jgi:hypothetical protein
VCLTLRGLYEESTASAAGEVVTEINTSNMALRAVVSTTRDDCHSTVGSQRYSNIDIQLLGGPKKPADGTGPKKI